MSSSHPHYGISSPAFYSQQLDGTLGTIVQIANDVEMKAPLSESLFFVIIDTNVLIHHFYTITQFVETAENRSLPAVVVIPAVVLYELDELKKRDGLVRLARRASAWLLGKVKERKGIKVQAHEETCKRSGNWKISDPGEGFGSERINDQLILDCSMYFGRVGTALLCSGDINLCIESERAGIPTISPRDTWNSDDFVQVIFGGSSTADDEQMMVDDDESTVAAYQPSHELDKLHLELIAHFTRLLVRLAGRVGGEEIRSSGEVGEGTSASRYAPQWQRKGRHYLEWTAPDVLEYLDTKKKIPQTSPRVEVFLSKPHTTPGARRGQDWSRRDWEVVLGGLERIGKDWDDAFIIESLGRLIHRVQDIFAMKMRPTGI